MLIAIASSYRSPLLLCVAVFSHSGSLTKEKADHSCRACG